MPVQPPYSIIDTIARLREQGGAAWGGAAAGVGESVGAGLQKGFARGDLQRQAAAKADAAKYHDATLFADKGFDWQHAPQASILQPAGAAAAGGGAPPPAPVKRPEGSVTMNDIYLAHGLKPVAGGDALVGVPKAQQKAEAASELEKVKEAGRKEIEATKAQAEKDVQAAKDEAKSVDINDDFAGILGIKSGKYDRDTLKAWIAANQRAGSSKTAADAKIAAAKIGADAKKAITDINLRLKSPDVQMQLQAMKDRDAYIIKNPKTAELFGTPADIGKIPEKKGKEKPAPADGGGDDLDALMVKHGGQ